MTIVVTKIETKIEMNILMVLVTLVMMSESI